MPLADDDIIAFQTATLALHEERDLDELRSAMPAILRALVPGDLVMWMESGFEGSESDDHRNVMHWEDPPRTPPAIVSRATELVEHHPFTKHARETGDWGPLRLSDFYDDAALLDSVFYREFYRHSAIGRLLAIATFRGNRIGTLNVTRPLSEPDFSERDRQLLRLVTPHFIQALTAAELTSARQTASEAPLATLGLTKRELEVARWIARGRTNPEIAQILEMAPRTVEKHVENILVKLGVENRTAAAMMIGGRVTHVPKSAPAAGTKPRAKRQPKPQPKPTSRRPR